MENTWSLKELYESFDDSQLEIDIENIKNSFDHMKIYPSLEIKENHLKDYLYQQNQLNDLIEKVYAFISLSMSTNTQNQQAIQYDAKIENLIASFADTNAKIEKWINQFDIDRLQDPFVLEHKFFLKEVQLHNQYLLDDQSEAVLASMKTTGSSAWLQYKNQLISSLTMTIDQQTYPLTEVLNMAYSKDKETRKKAYEAEIKAYSSIEQGIASALNGIKGEALTIARLRGYDSVLKRTLIDSRMSQKTLDILLSTMQEALPIFHKYYQLKAQYLGYQQGLPWYDLYAPVIDKEIEYSYEKGYQFVIEQFSSFSKNLGDYAKKAIENHWIDVYPRQGKVGGAYCHNLHCIQESRFLLNYGNQFGDVITMAHELGHGFHGHCLNSEHALNADYPMPIAETASTFCETIVKNAALKHASKEEQIMILENELCDCAQIIVDIYSRYLFESRVLKERENGPLSVEKIKDMMIEAQKEAYGQGLDHQYLHPYMWTWKSHYYEVDYAFYNFPYAFGLLLAKGLYAMYQAEGPSFAGKYEKFLSITGKMSLEDMGKTIGIDLQDKTFWQNSIHMIEEDIIKFEKLLKD